MIIDLIYPRRCPACHDPVLPRRSDGRPALICKNCSSSFSYVSNPVCAKCGKELESENDAFCSDCKEHEKFFAKNLALFNYDDVARESMVMFKYKGRREYADYYAQELLKMHADYISSLGIELIVPVPIHKSRREERGYNQAAEIGERISKALHIPMREDVLVRYKKTTAQKKLSQAGRMRNLCAVMKVNYDLSNIGRILLVDDIYTTGSTLDACSKVLLDAGCKEVFCVTVCIGKNS